VTKLFGKHRKAAGLPNASLHGLRHAHATMLLQSGVSVRTVSQRLGHKNPNVTMAVYSHVLPGDDEAAALVGAKALRRAL
jgi:integrase